MSRTVKLTLEANVNGLTAGLKTAQKATNDFARETQGFVKKHQQDLQTLGDASAKVGAGAALGLGLVAKAAMGWESAWTGVLKTVDGTPAQLGEVEDGLRGLARVLPSSHTEIAAVAEAAGQLGVKTGDVVGFTKVMIDLGQSTNLSAEDAATSLARFSNVMGTSTKDVGRLGATLVGLGNNYATTESEIMAMSMRLAGAGRQIGLSEGQTMGLAAAMSSVGIEAEAGGSAMSLTMKRIGKAVDNGGGTLEMFAKTAGMSADQFAKKWKGDAAGGLESFVVGLGKAGEQGDSVNAILTELGITGIRESDALLRLSAAGELMGAAMKQGALEYQAGTALIEEATKRYETAESKVSIAWNNIKDAAIDAGSVMLPVISQMAEGVAGLAQWFTSLPQPVKTFVLALGGLVAAGGLGFAAVSKVARSAADLSTAFANIAPAGGRARGAISRVGKTAGLAAIAVTSLAVAADLITEKHATTASDYADAVIKVAKAGEKADASNLDAVFSDWDKVFGQETVSNINSVAEAIDLLANHDWQANVNQFFDGFTGLFNLPKSQLGQVEERLKGLGEELGNIVSGGNAEQAADAFRVLAAEFQNNGMSAQDALDTMPGYSEALKKIAADAGETVEPNELLQWALTGIAPAAVAAAQGLEQAGGVVGYVGNAAGESIPVTKEMAEALADVGVSAEGSISGLSAFVDYLFASGLAVMSSRDAAFKWSDTLRDLGGEIDDILGKQGELGSALNKNATDFNKSTDTGKAANEKFTNTLREGLEVAKTYAGDVSKSQGDVQKQLESTYKAGVKTAEGFGLSKDAAKELTRETMGIPKDVDIKSWMSDEAKRVAEEITGAVREIPEQKKIKVLVTEEGSVPATQEMIDDITGRTVATYVTDEGTVLQVQGGIDNIEGKTEYVLISEDGTATVVQQQINEVTGKTEYVTVDDAGTAGDVQAKINNISGKSVTINVGYNDPGFKGDGHSSSFAERAAGGPIFGPGTGTSDSIPALLSNGEHVWTADEVRKAGGHAGIERLRGLAKAGLLPAFATGGRVNWSKRDQKSEWREYMASISRRQKEERDQKAAQKAYDNLKNPARDIPGDKDNKDRKRAAQRKYEADKKALKGQLEAAKKATERAKKSEAALRSEYKDAQARTERLNEGTFDLKRDVKRGSIVDSVMSGGGMGVVDRILEASKNKDLSKKQRRNLEKVGYSSEAQLLKMEKRSESLSKSLEKATSRYEDLVSIRDSVASGLRGEQSLSGFLGLMDEKAQASAVKSAEKASAKLEASLSKVGAKADAARTKYEGLLSVRDGVSSQLKGSFDLGGLLGQKNDFGYDKPVDKKSVLDYGKQKAAGAKKLSDLVAKLQGKGFNPMLLEQVIDEWASAGTFQLGNALLSMSKSEASSLNKSLASVESYGKKAGTSFASSMHKGGISAAKSLMVGLESQEAKLQNKLSGMLAPDAEGKITAKGMISNAKNTANRIKAFADKLGKLADRGLDGVILQEIAGMGTEEGSRVADALLAGSSKTSKQNIAALNEQYKRIATYSKRAGTFVTEGFFDGGVNAALGIKKGLESQQKVLDDSMTKLAKSMEKALKKAWGIKSPSTVMADHMGWIGKGGVKGLKAQEKPMADAMESLISTPDKSFGGWAVGSPYHGGPSSAPVMELSAADRALMSQFVMAAQSQPEMKLVVNGRQAGAIVQEGSKATGRLK